MQELAPSASAKSPFNFANLLASLTGTLQNDDWNNNALADDVATLTYEQALGSHRHRIPAPANPGETQRQVPFSAAPHPKPLSSTGKRNSKSASITIRVTAEEQAQLQQRAAAAQLSVSAYLRSCIFEAESLRTQVREALAEMQSAAPKSESPAGIYGASRNWYDGLFPFWSRRQKQSSQSLIGDS